LPWNIGKSPGIFFNNLYFLVLTGVIVVAGNHLYNNLHLREFVLRFELDQSRTTLEQTNQKLVELDQIKSRFFANISHELRTPLTLLLAPLETLLQNYGSRFDEDARELLVIMQSNGMRLLKLINDLLDLVRLESGKMEVKQEPVAIEAFLKGLGNAVRKTAEDRGIRLRTSVDPELSTVLTDGDKLEKILLNLLFNALKFTAAGGAVQLSAARENGHMLLTVSDTGIGISEEKLPFVFDRFWQGDTSSQRRYQGVGIGLALVKELVEIQGGAVSVASAVGKGTEFSVRLPYVAVNGAESAELESSATEVQAQPSSPDDANGQATWVKEIHRKAELFPSLTSLHESVRPIESVSRSGPPRVLVADDEPDMLRYLKSALNSQFQVIEAVDGQQAIDKASQFLPDVIVCDMMMPQKDGLEVCRELRERTSTQAIPILLLTARADEETKLAVLSAGANDFVTKPFSSTELGVRLKNLVDGYHLQRELARKNQILESTLEQLKETEAQLAQSEKLASLGRMSAGIIHEINNPLNFTKTGLYTLRTMAEPMSEEDRAEFLEVIHDVEDGINRITNIVSELRTFTQPNVTHFAAVSVATLVNSALRFLSNEWRDIVTIEKEISEHHTIWANSHQVTQVLVNLFQNALDALKRAPEPVNNPTIWVRSFDENGESLVVIRDNGEGIPTENLYKVFDPFFTTKDVGEGMGLGLSICYRIMKQHGGRIDVRSEPNSFSEFTLRFPQKHAEYQKLAG
jgi:signal transduction histidine kinase